MTPKRLKTLKTLHTLKTFQTDKTLKTFETHETSETRKLMETLATLDILNIIETFKTLEPDNWISCVLRIGKEGVSTRVRIVGRPYLLRRSNDLPPNVGGKIGSKGSKVRQGLAQD